MLEKADRPAHRVIPKSRLAKLDTIDEGHPEAGWDLTRSKGSGP